MLRMAAKKVKKPEYKGKNVRINAKSFDLLKKFCDEKGYKIGVFFEIGALDKMKNEVVNSIN